MCSVLCEARARTHDGEQHPDHAVRDLDDKLVGPVRKGHLQGAGGGLRGRVVWR